MDEPESFLPLPIATLHILVALGAGEMHGYAIMRAVEDVSDGAVRLGPGTLYGAIKRMLADGLIEETDERPDPAIDDERRRYYRLTGLGERVRGAELHRLTVLVRRAGSTSWAKRWVPTMREA
jgi:DNA-binding PadR family transcriptional regulator